LTDLPLFAEYRADPVLAEFQGWEPMNWAAAQAFLQQTVDATHLLPGQWIQLAVASGTSDQLLGDVGLFISEDCTFAELGFTLARQHQGKGHATRAAELAVQQAFRIPTVREVRAVTDQLNHASISVLNGAAFSQYGTREAVFKGKPCVELLFARERSEA
jgi:RimJ/RimL family protein N-acetyltransferase